MDGLVDRILGQIPLKTREVSAHCGCGGVVDVVWLMWCGCDGVWLKWCG